MSSVSVNLSFDISLVPAGNQAEFMAHVFQLITEYHNLTSPAPYPQAPAADTLPMPTSFVAVEGDGGEKAPRKMSKDSLDVGQKTLEQMTGQELRDRWASLVGKPAGLRSSGKLSNKTLLIEEIRRLEAVPEVAVVTEVASTTSSKKPRKVLTPEQKEARRAALKASREAKKQNQTAEANTDANTVVESEI